ncbi:sterol desaturase family protein [Mangrovibrevibacter kandeliae]|uniref:sterol desaturase family protein n=1 Tax=Mangrovibrevibacter kandeliae TaxID=2968473 RepID=UPI0021185116|nr:sterol desaturase family protein [Aurantimonas sp. CSK15Z-1]MCQ8781339.1 sterol desaturase family protein [Aurantimonas sp. CSK15Z-1]
MDALTATFAHAAAALSDAVLMLVIPTVVFGGVALLAKRRRAVADAFRAADEVRLNLLIHFFDALLVGPILALLAVAMTETMQAHGLQLIGTEAWGGVPAVLVGFAAVFAGDFVGYWRHRLEHTRYLWPSHAVHHSDTEMTWTTLSRFHPINRLSTTILDGAFLALLGLPPYAIVVNALVRHYYGYFVHADLPWTYGPVRWIFVSPAMHRWHHALDRRAFDTNYATVFSCFDIAFGTFRVPGPCDAPLGVTDDMGKGLLDQLTYALKPRAYRKWWRKKKPAVAAAALPVTTPAE